MKKLSEMLGLSRTTISYALNPEWKRLRISEETRDRVVKLVDATGYRPNKLATGLRTRQSKTVGVLVPAFLGGSEHDLLVGAESALGDEYTALIGSSRYSDTRELKILHSFEERMIDGLLVTPINNKATKQFLQQMLDRGTPVVQMDRYLPGLKTSIVELDNAQLTRICTEHLISLGHRKIAYIGSMYAHTGTAARELGYRKTMQAAGLKPMSFFTHNPNLQHEEYFRGEVRRLLASSTPTAIVAHTFAAVFQEITRLGFRCPEDISLAAIALDAPKATLDWAMWTVQPTLAVSSVEQMGARAAELLLQEIKGPTPGNFSHIKIPGRLIIGNSTCPPKSR